MKKFLILLITLNTIMLSCSAISNNVINTDIQINTSNDSIIAQQDTTNLLFNESYYYPTNITPQNASYHPSYNKLSLEWWYFEGIFDNGYTAIVNIILLSRNNIGICIAHLNIFHVNNSDASFAQRTYYPLSQFHGSTNYPDISIKENKIIDFNEAEYNFSKKWIYNLTFELNENAVDLEFLGVSDGWEGNVIGGFYGPVLPIADVKGTIKFGDTSNSETLMSHPSILCTTFRSRKPVSGSGSSRFSKSLMAIFWIVYCISAA